MDIWKDLPLKINYNSNQEYRQWIRKVFHFSNDAKTYFADLSKEDIVEEGMDEESMDEMLFDMSKMNAGLDFFYKLTEFHPEFQELYIHAAAQMFSTDPTIGQAVLCSYDYFHLYYTCVWHFLKDNYVSVEIIPEYHVLKTKIVKQ